MEAYHEKQGFPWAVRTFVIGVLAVTASAQSQAPTPDHFSGILNDYTAATGIGGPWEMHATWSLKLKRDSKADFSVVMTMEHPDYWVLANPTPRVTPPAPTHSPTVDNPGLRNPHTHHLTMTDATVSYDPTDLALCPSDSPATTPPFRAHERSRHYRQQDRSPISETTHRGYHPIPASGLYHRRHRKVTYSNMTMTFHTAAPAIHHFGRFPSHGVVRLPHKPEDPDHEHDDGERR